ncbi:MAG: hypothetical protein LUD72_12385 [Bacteroidales bacterium]|nr:hypothetical protein [Bacteroidales bacterium]
MTINSDNIDSVLLQNGLIKEEFNIRSGLGRDWVKLYDKNLDGIISTTRHIVNCGRDKETKKLLDRRIDIAKTIIEKSSYSSAEYLGLETEIDGIETPGADTAGISGAVRECLRDTVTANSVIRSDLERSGENGIKIIREVYGNDADDIGYATDLDPDSFKTRSLSVLHDADEILDRMILAADEILDDSSRRAYDFAYRITEAVCGWRDAAVYSYLVLGEDMLDFLIKAEGEFSEWNAIAVGVDPKNNPRVSDTETESIRKLWAGDQASLYAVEAKKRGIFVQRGRG